MLKLYSHVRLEAKRSAVEAPENLGKPAVEVQPTGQLEDVENNLN